MLKKIYFSEIETFIKFQNLTKWYIHLKILKKPQKANYFDTDINLINKLKRFDQDDEIIKNFINFYRNIILD